MAVENKRFIFRPLAVIFAIVSTGVTILLGALQIGSWVNRNAVWILWGTIAVLIVSLLLLAARLAALKEQAKVAERAAFEERLKAERATNDVVDVTAQLQAVEAGMQATGGLSKLDQLLAEQLFGDVSNKETLTMLANFFPYEILHGPVELIEKLSALPMTRVAHDDELARHFKALTDAAHLWLLKFTPVVWRDGDNFSTRLVDHVSEEAYEKHRARTNELAEAGFDLHDKMLAYQRYYASL